MAVSHCDIGFTIASSRSVDNRYSALSLILERRRGQHDLERGPDADLASYLDGSGHRRDQIASDGWNRPYSREAAAFPAKTLLDYKFWPHVSRIDNVYGDRNPVCSCAGMENYTS